MQTLTGQYPTMYTHKFRCFPSDFAFISASFYGFKILTLKPTYEVLAIKMRQTAIFGTGTAATGRFKLAQYPFIYSATNDYSIYGEMPLNFPITSTSGFMRAMPFRYQLGTSNDIIGNISSAYDVWLTMVSNINPNIMTRGIIEVWITTIKMP